MTPPLPRRRQALVAGAVLATGGLTAWGFAGRAHALDVLGTRVGRDLSFITHEFHGVSPWQLPPLQSARLSGPSGAWASA